MNHSEFKNKACAHQIRFKEEVLNIPPERSAIRTIRLKEEDGTFRQKEITVRSSLRASDAKDNVGNYVIFFPGFRKEITEYIDRSISGTKTQIVTNLLRSEHIPFNIFFPMRKDPEGTKVLFNHILGGDRIAEIKRIEIEYKPIGDGLKDGTAFDVFIGYLTPDGQPGGIGIEVKYTEKEYPIKKDSKEWNRTHQEDRLHLADNYRTPSFEIGWFKENVISDAPLLAEEHVAVNQFRQIWRNHLLGASMILNSQLSEFTSLTVYPEGNVHFQKVLPDYKKTILTDSGRATFRFETYERLFSLMEESFNPALIPNLNDWISYLRQRYIVK